MSGLSLVYTLLFYAAALLFVGGVVYKVIEYARTPAPLKIPTMPAPMTRGGVAARMASEVFFFHSLFRSNRWIWLFGFMFHVALALVLLRHLRYFFEPVWFWVTWVQPVGIYAGFAMLIGLAGLWARRLLVERIRYISQPSDHLMLVLLLAIGGSGMLMKFVAHTDIVAFKAFTLGLVMLEPQPLPADPLLLVHLGLVILLMAIFPFSKLLHAPGIFFSPTRNQVDDSRSRRHLAPWAGTLER